MAVVLAVPAFLVVAAALQASSTRFFQAATQPTS
jgi:hypothetical protein